MNFSAVGDLAQNLMLRRQSSGLQGRMDKLTQELVTGRHADLGNAVKGDFSKSASLQRSFSVSDAFTGVRKTVSAQLAAQQSTLARIAEPVSGLGLRVLEDMNSENQANLNISLRDVSTQFDSTLSALNTQFAGKSLFSGNSPDQSAVADGETMLADLRLATAGATTAADFIAAVDTWFNAPGGGFETLGFTGTPPTGSGVSIDENTTIPPQIAADAPAIRAALGDMAMMTLASEASFAGDAEMRSGVIRAGAEQLVQSNTELVELRADIGDREAMVAQSDTRAAAHRFAMEQLQNDLTTVDPYAAATELEAVRSSLETLYMVTSRTSQLSLADYLR